MTLEEKIAHLQTTSMEQARLEGNVIIDTHQAALEKVFEDHKAEATRQSETRIKAEAANAKLSLNQALAKSQLEIKRRQNKDLEGATRVHLTISAEDFRGGVRAVIRSRNILIDNSFSTQLKEQYDKFVFLGGDGIA